MDWKTSQLNGTGDPLSIDELMRAEPLPHGQFGPFNVIWSQIRIRGPTRQHRRVAIRVYDIAAVVIATANPANIADVMCEGGEDGVQPVLRRDGLPQQSATKDILGD